MAMRQIDRVLLIGVRPGGTDSGLQNTGRPLFLQRKIFTLLGLHADRWY